MLVLIEGEGKAERKCQGSYFYCYFTLPVWSECFLIFIIFIIKVELCFECLTNPYCYFNDGSLHTQNINSGQPVIFIILAAEQESHFFIFISVSFSVPCQLTFLFLLVLAWQFISNKAFAVPTFKNPYESRVYGFFMSDFMWDDKYLLPVFTHRYPSVGLWVTQVTN